MRGPIGPKQAHSRPQRRHQFHNPHQPPPQRRRRFHEHPKNTTHDTNARPRTYPHEAHDANARWLTLTFETRDANARPHRPKTGPFTPAKATPVSQPTPTTPAKAIPVSRKAEEHNPHHHHEAPNTHPRDLSTGVMLNASYPQGYNSSFSSRFQRAIIHQSAPYPQLQMVVSNCYLNSSHPSDLRFALLAFMERKYSCIASERTAMF